MAAARARDRRGRRRFGGGRPGLVAGAGIGAMVEGANDDTGHLPDPSGVTVVVDVEADADQIETILRSCGATNVQAGPSAR